MPSTCRLVWADVHERRVCAGWEGSHNNDTLDNVISDWVAFQTAYNSAYDSHQTCDQAYEAARQAHDGYRRVEWDDELSDRPGTEYDQHVGRLLASDLWLRQRGCPGAFDFASVG